MPTRKYVDEADFLKKQCEKIKASNKALTNLLNYIEDPNFCGINRNNINKVYKLYENVKRSLGNFYNDIGHITTRMAQYWLEDSRKDCNTDKIDWLAPQSSNGFDIDIEDCDKSIIGEIKSTIPEKKDNTLGSSQWNEIKKDLTHLTDGKKGTTGGKKIDRTNVKPSNRFMFVVDENAFKDIINKNKKKEYRNFTLVLLGTEKTEPFLK